MTSTDQHQVFIVDHHDIVREGLAWLIAQESDLAVSGQASSMTAAMLALNEARPDLVIIDDSLPEGNSVEMAELVITEELTQGVLVLTNDRTSVPRLPRVGVFPKTGEPEALIATIRALFAGNALSVSEPAPVMERIPPYLSRMLEALVAGHTITQIAHSLGLSPHTAKTYVRELYGLLGTTNRAETVAIAIRHELV